MFGCKSRLRRAFRTLIILDRQTAHPESLILLATKKTSLPLVNDCRRNHATIANIQKGHHIRLLREAFQSNDATPLSTKETRRGPSRVLRKNAKAKENNKRHLDIQKDEDGNDPAWVADIDQALQTELRWTGGDALKLAKTVLNKLKVDDPLRALQLIRASEKMPNTAEKKRVDSVVSWNHVMDYFMSKSMTRTAFKMFNEVRMFKGFSGPRNCNGGCLPILQMKKRGHKPDAHTYTIMLRGFAMNHKKPNAVDEAMKVYDSMYRPGSDIKPNIIHSNAIINCLGRALNMDALWSVAGRLPDRGPGAPDKWTYTTILNTMQACIVRDARQLTETDGDQEAAARLVQSTVGEGRRLWEDIVSRWKSGDVSIDQTLVCAMGRLLLLGQKQDWDDIFSLIEQTMRLPRINPPLKRRGRVDSEDLEKALALPPPKDEEGSSDLEQLELAVADEAAPRVKNEFAVLDLSDRPVRDTPGVDSPGPYARIGNNVLSLLIEAAIKLKAIPVGKMYWDKLTNPDNQPFVAPDEDNLRSYLRLLRISRSSKVMVDLLRQPINSALEGIWYKRAHFVLAMSTCARDFKNQHVFTHASTILDLMQEKLSEPDMKVMTMYLSLAMVTTPGVSAERKGEFNAHQGENNLLRALRRLHSSGLDYRLRLRKWIEMVQRPYEWPVSKKELDVGQKKLKLDRAEAEDEKRPAPPEEVLEFLQTVNSACDKVMNHIQKLTDQEGREIATQKRDASWALQRLNPKANPPSRAKLENREPADAVADHDEVLDTKDYGEDTGMEEIIGDIEGPELVDLHKIHPFQRDQEASRRKERRPKRGKGSEARSETAWSGRGRNQGSRSTSSAEQWSNAWKKSVQRFGGGEKSKEWVVV